MIELKNVNKTFHTADQTIVALDGIDLTIEDGEIFGIIGLSGAGKSTLVRCINLLEKPTRGQVLVDGRDLMTLSRRELLRTRRSIGMIFQGFNLLEQRNVLKNICFPLELAGVKKEDAQARALELLKLVGLEDRASSYPSQLSGGMQQRAMIAMVIAQDTEYVLLDEPTNNLDIYHATNMMKIVRRLCDELGKTVILVLHEINYAAFYSDYICAFKDGKIAKFGTVEEVMTKENLSQIYQVDFEILTIAGKPLSIYY